MDRAIRGVDDGQLPCADMSSVRAENLAPLKQNEPDLSLNPQDFVSQLLGSIPQSLFPTTEAPVGTPLSQEVENGNDTCITTVTNIAQSTSLPVQMPYVNEAEPVSVMAPQDDVPLFNLEELLGEDNPSEQTIESSICVDVSQSIAMNLLQDLQTTATTIPPSQNFVIGTASAGVSLLPEPLTGTSPSATLSTGVPKAPTGVPTALTGVPTALTEVPTAPTGVTTAPTGVPTSPTGVPTALTGVPAAPSVVPTALTGIPTAPSGVPTALTGVPTAPSGVPTTLSGVPTALTTVPTAITTVPTAITGVHSSPTDGVLTAPTGTQPALTGLPMSSMGIVSGLSKVLAESSGPSFASTTTSTPEGTSQTKEGGVNIGELLKLSPEALNELVRTIAMAQLRVSVAATVQSNSSQSVTKASSPSLLPKPQATHPSIPKPQATQPSLLKPQATQPSLLKPQATQPSLLKPQAAQASILRPQPLTITLANGSKLSLSSLTQGGKGKSSVSATRTTPQSSTHVTTTLSTIQGLSVGGGISAASTITTYPGMSLGETCYPYPRPQPVDISVQPKVAAGEPVNTSSSMLHSTNVKDGLESLAMVASLVPKADASGEIDVGEPIHITPLLLPECLQDHNYTTYNPEFSHPKMYMEVDKSLTAAHIPGNRLSYAPGVPQQHLTLQKMLKLSQKMKMQREAPEREKKILKKQKVSSGLQKIKKKEVVAEGSSEDENGDDGDDSNSRRRSARNLGRRKKYVDDIDVNLSDYEEAGDSDDERQKAYKKKKYGLKEEVEVDSDSEKPAKITLTQLRQGQQQTHSVTNYTDGLVQASVYYEPPEEEAQVVEKIMGHRTRPTKPEEKVYGEKIEEYLVKYKNFSYLHVEWGTFQKLIKGDKRFDQKLKRYKQKQEQLGPFADVDDEPFNPDYTVAERVLDMATQEEPNGEVVTHLLVKWKSLPYEDSTWELEEDIDRDKLERYLELQQTPSRSVMEFHPRPAPSDFRPIKESPEYRHGNLLRPYQLEGLNWLLFNWYTRQNCILADEMGLGKTVQSIAFLKGVKDANIRGPFLVIVPLTTITNWQREFEAWADFNVVVYHGSLYSRNLIHEYELYFRNHKGRNTPGAYKFNVIITTYEVLLAPQCELRNIQWRVCILDEAHRLKNRNCKVLEELKHINTEHRVLLTGTPLQNSVEELFSLLNFLEPVRFPSEEAFLIEYGNLKTEEEVEKLKSILRPMMLRRLKEDVEKSLAPKEETIVEVELTGIQKQYYRAILEKNFNFLAKSGGANVPSLLNTMMELRKCCNHPFLIKGAEQKIVTEYVGTHPHSNVLDALVQSSGKVVLIDKLLPKLKASGHKVLIFSQMVKCLDILEDYLRAKGYLYERIDGQIRGILRQAAIDRFSKPDSDRFVFLLCTRAGGLGINLTAADTVIIYDSDWNPQNDIQAQSRCHRIGQSKMVKVYRLITRNSYEREMFDRASLKLGLDRALLQSMAAQKDSNAPQMGKKEIEDLLKKGAYAAVMEENDDSEKFCQEDIDQILERRTKVIQLDSESAGSTFSKASFVADGSSEDLDITDPDFWQKWAEKAKLDLDQLASKDNLIIDQPRQRRQTRRFGNDSALVEEVEEEEAVDLVPARGKKGWTKLELQKVERYLLIYGWNQWKKVLHSGFKGKKIRLNERDVENMSRTILVYCLHHFKGDEKARPLIHRLIDPSEEAPGKPDLATLHANPFAFTEDDYLALMAKDPETLFQEEVYKKHLKKHANRIILRVRQLHIIRWEIFGDQLEKIKQGVPAKEIHVHLALPEDPPPVLWWNMEADKSLLIGTIKYGYEQYGLMRSDSNLCFKSIVGAEPVVGRTSLRSNAEDGSSNQQLLTGEGGELDSAGEEEGIIDSDEDTLELDLAPRKLPRMKRTPVKLPLAEGKQVWPTVADLNTRLRRLVSAYLKSQRQQVLKMEKMKKQQARKEKEKEASRQRELKRAELAQKWSRREEQDFARVIAFFGVVYDRESQSYNWERFRHLANLGKKSDDRLTTYYIDFRNMCQRVINGQRPKKGKSGHVLERVTEDRASKCLQRIDVLSAIREEVLPHPEFTSLIRLCEASFEVPHWWLPVTHDVDLLRGVDRYGLARSEHLLYPDPQFSFVSTVPKSALFNEQDKMEESDSSDSEEKMDTAVDESQSHDVITSSGGSGQEKESKSHSLGVPIGWPKEKAIVMRLTRIVFAFRKGYWPKPMEGLELFTPKRQEVDESEEEIISDSEDNFNTSSDYYDPSMEYMAGDYGNMSSSEDGEEEEDYSLPDSDSDYCVDVEESSVAWSSKKKTKSKRSSQPAYQSSVDPQSTVSFSVNKGTDLKLTIKRSLLTSKNEKKPPKSLIVSIPRVLLSFPTRAEVKKMPKIQRKRKTDKESSRAKRNAL